ncbi:hypothetical protein QWZ13_07785 [Reinekea marina]|nr:hypothetical protein [Reinekea marina]MDN3648808.1 hypothetical protein [Reinekea marina]
MQAISDGFGRSYRPWVVMCKNTRQLFCVNYMVSIVSLCVIVWFS